MLLAANITANVTGNKTLAALYLAGNVSEYLASNNTVAATLLASAAKANVSAMANLTTVNGSKLAAALLAANSSSSAKLDYTSKVHI